MEASEQPTFEETLEQLESVARELELGRAPLNRSLELFEKAVGLLRSCRSQLEVAELRVRELVAIDENGVPQLREFAHKATFGRSE